MIVTNINIIIDCVRLMTIL